MKSPEELEKLYVRKIRAYNALAIGYLIGGDRESAKKAVGTMIVLSRRRGGRQAVPCRRRGPHPDDTLHAEKGLAER